MNHAPIELLYAFLACAAVIRPFHMLVRLIKRKAKEEARRRYHP